VGGEVSRTVKSCIISELGGKGRDAFDKLQNAGGGGGKVGKRKSRSN